MTKKVYVECCYCKTNQPCDPPPSVQKCVECGHDFRTFYNESGKAEMELNKAAMEFFKRTAGEKTA